MRRRLNFRCRQCRTITTATAGWEGKAPFVVTCSTCRCAIPLAADRDRGATDREYHELVRSVATTYGIDVATANSLFEGILSLDEALEFKRRPMAFAEEKPKGRGRGFWIGAGFAAVVLTGLIVAGVGLGGEKAAPSRAKMIFEKPAAVAASVPDAEPDEQTHESPVVYWTGDSGLLTEVSGADPRSVLEGFCAHAQNEGILTPVEIRAAEPPNPGVRVGVLRDLSRPGYKVTVLVRRDLRTGRWYLGDRHGEIRLEDAGYDPTEDGRQE